MRKPLSPKIQRKLKQHLAIVGRNLHTLRKARKESLKTVGSQIHMASTTLSRMEKGLYNFKLEKLWQLSKYYGVEVDDILFKGFPDGKKQNK
ncbi:Helix-turn-helix [Filimonas lacunae]|uniref:Helix-turn-helix n=1 Tax=Filimonas lacunae TaxID=477680 RepID=A0A1N7RGY9_9BACT|nr:helix-turn-helix transcriptional regulator [Filimonas lacunae]SIT34254.1 Helix-turn-helix [Filimonas lacunae]